MSSQSSTASSPKETVGEGPAIGVDIGVKQLIVAAPATISADLSDALVVEGETERALYDGLENTISRLDRLPIDTAEAEQVAFENYRMLLRQRLTLAAHELLDYVDRHDASVVGIEDLDRDPRSLRECCQGQPGAGSWIFPRLLDQVEAELNDAGYPVQRVNPKYTTQACHSCGHLTSVRSGTISCPTDTCPVDVVCRDRSAAVSIAHRTGDPE